MAASISACATTYKERDVLEAFDQGAITMSVMWRDCILNNPPTKEQIKDDMDGYLNDLQESCIEAAE